MLRAVAKEEASSLQWWSMSNIFCIFIRSDKHVGGFVLTLVILFCGIDITVEVRGRVGLLELLVGDVFSSVNFFS